MSMYEVWCEERLDTHPVLSLIAVWVLSVMLAFTLLGVGLVTIHMWFWICDWLSVYGWIVAQIVRAML